MHCKNHCIHEQSWISQYQNGCPVHNNTNEIEKATRVETDGPLKGEPDVSGHLGTLFCWHGKNAESRRQPQ
jgi:hypothetical protein